MRIRTGYSFRWAAGSAEAVMARLLETGYEKIKTELAPITDRNSTFGFVKWSKLCKQNNVRPIYGVELGVSADIKAKKPVVDHWTFLAKDNLSSINRLVQIATRQFRYQPLLTYEQALGAEGTIKLMGHRIQLQHVQSREDLYLALAPSTAKGLVKSAKKAGHKLCLSNDNNYPRMEDRNFYELVCGRNAETHTYPQHILTPAELYEYCVNKFGGDETDEASYNCYNVVAEQCRAQLLRANLLSPIKNKTLLEMCEIGAQKLNVDLNNDIYAERLGRELALIAQKKFEDYFYIIADLVNWSRERMLVGPARGSSCGSLVCYLLGITTIDPIQYGLIFERFIDINRADLPDIDIDFSDQHRDLIYDYMARKYGSDRVAKLGTVAMFKPRSALQEAGMAFKIPRWRCEAFADTIITRSGGDSRALQTMEDSFAANETGKQLLKEFPGLLEAAKMEGHPRHHSTHAAGIVVTERPIIEYVAIDEKTGSIHCDKKDAEELNLLKIDALGLTQLSIFEDALELACLPRMKLESVPRDDQAAFDILNKGNFAGIFQFNGDALQSLSKQIKFNSLNDIVAITALARPGPLASGGATTWVQRKIGAIPVSYPHPAFEPYLSETLGVVIYQEQVMEIGRNIGNLSWEEVSELRKAMSKSLGKEYFDKFGDKFKIGAKKKDIDEKILTRVWDDLCAYGSWSFNKSHAVAYGLISYYCCWLKAHYPVEFAAASLTHEKDEAKQLVLLRELAEEGISYKTVDIERSRDKWTVAELEGKKQLIGPLTNWKGMGPKNMQAVMSARSRNEPISERAAKIMNGSSTKLNSLFPIMDKFKELLPDPRARNILTPPTMIKRIDDAENNSEHVVFCIVDKIAPRDENEAVNVARRNGQVIVDGPTASLIMHLRDDTGTMIAKISRYDYEAVGAPIVAKGGAEKAMYVMKGKLFVRENFRMLMVKAAKYIGELS